jgi:hypothetical protein
VTPSSPISVQSNGSGVLLLTGTGTEAQYQAALRAVTFSSTASDSVTREFEFQIAPEVSGKVYVYDTAHFYQKSTDTLSQSAAVSASAALQFMGQTGYLITADTVGENALLMSYNVWNWISGQESLATNPSKWKYNSGPLNRNSKFGADSLLER